MQSGLKHIISGVVCLACVVTSATAPGAVPVNAVNPDNPVIVDATENEPKCTENGLYYEIYEDHAEITGYRESAGNEVTIPEMIESLPVTSIGKSAFSACTYLESVTIPESVKNIGEEAFFNCYALKSVLIPYGVSAIEENVFNECHSLESVIIPDSVTSIADSAFRNCCTLQSITIPASVTDISYDAFGLCTSLTAFHVDPENQDYMDLDGVLFSKDQAILLQYPKAKTDSVYAVPDGVTTIASCAFFTCNSLVSVIIPDTVTEIEESAFCFCSALESVSIPDSVINIGYGVFSSCFSLESVTIQNPDCEIDDVENTISDTAVIYGYPGSTAQAYAEKYNREFVALEEQESVFLENLRYKKYEDHVEITDCEESVAGKIIIPETIGGLPVTSIGFNAFSNCTALESVIIPGSVTNIEARAFAGCTALESVIIPDSVTSIGEGAFWNCSSLKNMTLPDSVTTIREEAFFDCSSLESVVIPDGVTYIMEKVFLGCSALESVAIPDTVTGIGSYAFAACSSLKSVTLPENVRNIESNAFADCSSLESIKIYRKEDCYILGGEPTISDTAVIYGYPGSTAQAYAEKYNRNFVALGDQETLWGDADEDGEVGIIDVVLMNRVYVGVDKISESGKKNADSDQDSKITLSDSMNVLRLLVHLLGQEDFPIQAE